MNNKEYAKSIIDILPDEFVSPVAAFMLNLSEEKYDEDKLNLVSRYVLEKYRAAFEELAK